MAVQLWTFNARHVTLAQLVTHGAFGKRHVSAPGFMQRTQNAGTTGADTRVRATSK